MAKPYFPRNIMRSGTSRGLIPNAGTLKASTLTRDVRQHIHQRAVKLRANITQIRRMQEVTIPGRTGVLPFIPGQPSTYTQIGYSGKKYQLGTPRNIGDKTKEFHGFEQFGDFGLLPSITVGAQFRMSPYDKFGKKDDLVDIKAIKLELGRIVAMAGLPHIGARFVVWHAARWAFMEVVYLTPYETGRAAASWRLSPQIRGKGKFKLGRVGFRIGTDVGYMLFLEHGHSKQAPQGMVRVTMFALKTELRNLLDTMTTWWMNEKYRLRGFRWDQASQTGQPIGLDELEAKLPSLTWRRLYSELASRLPLDRNVSHLNADAFLAMRINDPKDWHSSGEFSEPQHTFESRMVRTISKVKWSAETFEGHTSGTRTESRTVVQHVRSPRSELERQAAELQHAWGQFGKPEFKQRTKAERRKP